jgi:hypothetical protein
MKHVYTSWHSCYGSTECLKIAERLLTPTTVLRYFYMTLETIYILRHGTVHDCVLRIIPWLTERQVSD